MNNFYNIKENIKIDSYLQIPKIFFIEEKYKNMSLNAKIIYSLYLSRYIITTYKDKVGLYIIYPDKEIFDKTLISRTSCFKAREELLENNLIYIKKTTGYNKIYLLNYNNTNAELTFFNPEDIIHLQFYKYPLEFFDKKYKNLSNKSKLLYCLYLDSISLSQHYYFIDKQERIYFEDNISNQASKLGVSQPTLRSLRNMLKVSNLLIEYKSFSNNIRFYLLKLSNFEDNIKEFKEKTKKDQLEYIKKLDKKNKLVINSEMKEVSNIIEFRDKFNISRQDIIYYINLEFNLNLSIETYKSYELGRRNMPNYIYSSIIKLKDILEKENISFSEHMNRVHDMKKEKHKNENSETLEDVHDMKNSEHDISDNRVHEMKKSKHHLLNIVPEKKISKPTIRKNQNVLNESNETYINYTNNNYTNNKINKEFKELINRLINIIYHSDSLKNIQDILLACFNKLNELKYFHLKNLDGEEKQLNLEDMYNLILLLDSETILIETCNKIISNIFNQGYQFKTPDNYINCFLTYLFNDLLSKQKQNQTPDWFYKVQNNFISDLKSNQNTEVINNTSEDVKEYKWWD